jgi:hypothetical protein
VISRPAFVAAVDASDQARLVLKRVGDQASRHDAADVHVLRVIDVPQRYADRVPLDDEHAALRAEVKEILEAFRPS